MENQASIYLALFDFVPNLAFLVGAYYLIRIAYLVRGSICSRIVTAGAMLILLGGLLQAIWKLLYTTSSADFRLMSQLQFILMAPGFVMLVIAVVMLLRTARRSTPPLLAVLPWKLPFLIVMVLASLVAQGLLCFISIRRGAYAAGVAFALAFVGLLAMGGMSGGEQTVAQQWIEEGVNALGQSAFALGSYLLYKNYKTNAC